MSRETLHESLAFLRAHSRGSLGLTLIGGEPLLCPDLVRESIDTAMGWKDVRVAIAIATNGTLLDADMLSLCQHHGVQLYLSLDGVSRAHDRHRRDPGGRGSHADVMARVPALLEAVPRTEISAVITPETAGMVGESLDHLLSLGFSEISMSLDFSAPWDRTALEALKTQYQWVANRYLERYGEGCPFRFSAFDDHIRTWILGSKARSACCDLGDQVLCQDSASTAACRTCALKARCFNWCGCTNWRSTGNRHQPPAILCEHERMLIPMADKVAEQLYAEQNPYFLMRFYGDGPRRDPRGDA